MVEAATVTVPRIWPGDGVGKADIDGVVVDLLTANEAGVELVHLECSILGIAALHELVTVEVLHHDISVEVLSILELNALPKVERPNSGVFVALPALSQHPHGVSALIHGDQRFPCTQELVGEIDILQTRGQSTGTSQNDHIVCGVTGGCGFRAGGGGS